MENTLKISILGDSISTYKGYSNNPEYNPTIGNNALWFPNVNYDGGCIDVSETWWMQVIKAKNFTLCVNNSWSGSKMIDPHTYDSRAVNLHDCGGACPDIIFFFMGINDYDAKITVADFSAIYEKILNRVVNAYPKAKIICLTPTNSYKYAPGGTNGVAPFGDYIDALIAVASAKNCRVVRLDKLWDETLMKECTFDLLHPNVKGMRLVANAVLEEIKDL